MSGARCRSVWRVHPSSGPGAHERGGVAPKVQTTSAKNADNGVSWVKWSAMQAQRHLASRVARTRTCYCEY